MFGFIFVFVFAFVFVLALLCFRSKYCKTNGFIACSLQNVEKPMVIPLLFEWSIERKAFQECKEVGEKDRFLLEKVVQKEQKGNK